MNRIFRILFNPFRLMASPFALSGSSNKPPLISFALILFIILGEIQIVKCSDEHLVFAGACNKEPPSFCDRLVKNSVCNRAKNECFCRKGFVAVKEGDGVACKTRTFNDL